jgi:hypothetical protein
MIAPLASSVTVLVYMNIKEGIEQAPLMLPLPVIIWVQ